MRGTCLLVVLLVSSVLCYAAAQLPPAPSQTLIQHLLSSLLVETRTTVSMDVRERVNNEIRNCTGFTEVFELYNRAGVLLFARAYPVEALWAFAEAANLNPEDQNVLNNIASVLIALDRLEEAEKLLLYVVNCWSNYAPSFVNLCIVYMREGRTDFAELCLDMARKIEPGFAPTERLAFRAARTLGDIAEQARSSLNWRYVDPKDEESAKAIQEVPSQVLMNEINTRLRALPVPEYLILMPAIESDVRSFALLEERDRFWGTFLNFFTQKSAEVVLSGQTLGTTKEIPSEVWNSLSEEQRQAMLKAGFKPAEAQRAFSPLTEQLIKAREHYPILAQIIAEYETTFANRCYEAVNRRAFRQIIDTESRRQMEYIKKWFTSLQAVLIMQYMSATAGESSYPAAGTIVTASTEYLREAFSTLLPAHEQMRSLLADTREELIRLVRSLYRNVAILIDMVPPQYRDVEKRRLEEVAASASVYYATQVRGWWMVARIPVLLEGAVTEIVHSTLQEQFNLARERYRTEAVEDIEELDEEVEDRNPNVWLGLDLDVFAVKLYGDRVEISGGKGIVGEAVYNFEEEEIYVGVGVGGKLELPYGAGIEAKGLIVTRIELEESEISLGVTGKVSQTWGVPVGGAEVDLGARTVWFTHSSF